VCLAQENENIGLACLALNIKNTVPCSYNRIGNKVAYGQRVLGSFVGSIVVVCNFIFPPNRGAVRNLPLFKEQQ
jgi:hypothetical protein